MHRGAHQAIIHVGTGAHEQVAFPDEHRHLAARFGQDVGVATLSWKSLALWLLGYPEAALAECNYALKVAREIGDAATLDVRADLRSGNIFTAGIARRQTRRPMKMSHWRTGMCCGKGLE
jgi:2-methylisocitrate lyase-like PEP mutase family enzyme